MSAMRSAMEDWKARQAGDEHAPLPPRETEERPPSVPQVITRLPPGRPKFCSGGMYVASHEMTGKPVVKTQPVCSALARVFVKEGVEYQASQCADCGAREKRVREALRDWHQPKDEPRGAGRARYT